MNGKVETGRIHFSMGNRAKIESIQPYGALLEQNGKSMKLNVEIPNSVKLEILVEDVSNAKAVQDSDNPRGW
jgi:hypothetical protein